MGSSVPVSRFRFHILHAKVEPLQMARSVEVGSQVQFVEISRYPENLAQVSRLEARLELQSVLLQGQSVFLYRTQTVSCT